MEEEITRLMEEEGLGRAEARARALRAEAAAAYQTAQSPLPRRIGPGDLRLPTGSVMPRRSPPSASPSSAPPRAPAWSGTGRPCADDPCRCGGAGYYVADAPAHDAPGFGQLITCSCTLRQRAARTAAASAGLLAQLHGELGRLAGCTLATFDLERPLWPCVDSGGTRWLPDAQRETLLTAADAAAAYAEDPRGWLYIHGPVGSGKSHLAAAIANAVASRGQAAAYATATGLISFIKAGFGDGSAEHRLASLQHVALLVIDDLGTQRSSLPGDWAFAQFYELLNARYLHERPTVLTSNLPPDHLEERLRDRVEGMAVEVHLVAASYRQAHRHQA